MIQDKIMLFEELIISNNITNTEAITILNNAKIIFNQDISTLDSEIKNDIYSHWNKILDEQIEILRERKKLF